ncbi:hypothetical protein DFH07DRAFT_963778 [Mycena maculata]|uniref:Uncharacterized protein n=1 Tax=Mycena maculata TaxID=230809 RepID=A0AAD7IIZ3_9AGAR|nr:hypothetical protein DFH07DRAFT_963778 [Mycena maculata]
MADIHMSDELADLIPGAKRYPYKVHGFNDLDKALMGHKPELVKLVKNNPAGFLGAVVLANDFRDRGRAAGAIRSIMEAEGLGRFEVYPATPEHPTPDGLEEPFPLPMPWTNIIPNVTPELRRAALSRDFIQGLYEEREYCFYFVDLTFEQPPFLVLTYWKIADGTEPAAVKNALAAKFLADPRIVEAANDHSYIPNEDKPAVLFRTILELATYRTFDYNLHGTKRTIWCIVAPPLSTDPAHTLALQRHLMAPGFSFEVGWLGTAVPWRNPSGAAMSCSACHSTDHYRHDCTIINSDAYLLRRGTHASLPPEWNAASRLPTSLNDEMDISDSPGPSNRAGGLRGRGRNRGRGGSNGYRDEGGNRNGRGNRNNRFTAY